MKMDTKIYQIKIKDVYLSFAYLNKKKLLYCTGQVVLH